MNRSRPGSQSSVRLPLLISAVILCCAVLPAHAEPNNDANGEKTSEARVETTTEEVAREPEPARPAVQPELEADTPGPPQIQLPDAETADIRQQIEVLKNSLEQRLVAVESTRDRLSYAESLLNRLQDEYNSFELRLEKAGLNLTGNYAKLLQQRLERLQRQGIAGDLIRDIENQLSTTREEQLRLEEFEAVIDPGDDARDQLRSQRASLIRQLHKAVTEHLQALNEYFNTVSALQESVEAYQSLLQQRLFWLPSASVVGADTLTELFEAVAWFSEQFRLDPLNDAIGNSIQKRGGPIAFLIILLAMLIIKRRAFKRNLKANSRYVGNVGHDRIEHTLYAFANSALLALPGVLLRQKRF